MNKAYDRTQRIGDFLQRELAVILRHRMRDPRLTMVNITAIEVSRDLAHAKVYVTLIDKNSAEEASEDMRVLNRAAGFLRTQLARHNDIRVTPALRFYFDDSVVSGSYLSNLIDQAIKADGSKKNGR